MSTARKKTLRIEKRSKSIKFKNPFFASLKIFLRPVSTHTLKPIKLHENAIPLKHCNHRTLNKSIKHIYIQRLNFSFWNSLRFKKIISNIWERFLSFFSRYLYEKNMKLQQNFWIIFGWNFLSFFPYQFSFFCQTEIALKFRKCNNG